MKRTITIAAVAIASALIACSDNASVASANLSTAADNFEINRRVVFYNGITDAYILTIEGLVQPGCQQPEEDRDHVQGGRERVQEALPRCF